MLEFCAYEFANFVTYICWFSTIYSFSVRKLFYEYVLYIVVYEHEKNLALKRRQNIVYLLIEQKYLKKNKILMLFNYQNICFWSTIQFKITFLPSLNKTKFEQVEKVVFVGPKMITETSAYPNIKSYSFIIFWKIKWLKNLNMDL